VVQVKKIIIPLLLVIVGCSHVKKIVVKDIPLEEQIQLLEKYRGMTAWTRVVMDDLKRRGVVPRDTKVKIIDLDFHWNGAVTIMTRKHKRIVYGLELPRPLTVQAIEDKLHEIFWFKSPLLRQVAYIRKWGKRTARAIKNHDVFIGMPAEAALESWGIPDKINAHEIGGKREEQWVYKVGKHRKYIYVIDNRVTKWED